MPLHSHESHDTMTVANEDAGFLAGSFLRGICIWEVVCDLQSCHLQTRLLAGENEIRFNIDCDVPDLVLRTVATQTPQVERTAPVETLCGASEVCESSDVLCCAFAFPIFTDGAVTSVVVLLGDRENHARGVFESWQPVGQYAELQMVHGCYVGLDRFENVSRFVRFEYGQGLPGMVWQTISVMIQRDLSSNIGFMRAAGASAAELDFAVGVPIFGDDFVASVLLISSIKSPIARKVEVWNVSDDGVELANPLGDSSEINPTDFAQISEFVTAIGRTNRPMISNDLTYLASVVDDSFERQPLQFAFGIPIRDANRIEVLVLYG